MRLKNNLPRFMQSYPRNVSLIAGYEIKFYYEIIVSVLVLLLDYSLPPPARKILRAIIN